MNRGTRFSSVPPSPILNLKPNSGSRPTATRGYRFEVRSPRNVMRFVGTRLKSTPPNEHGPVGSTMNFAAAGWNHFRIRWHEARFCRDVGTIFE